MSSKEIGFSKERSKVSDDTMAKFLENDLKDDITTVPGIGKAAKEKLAIVTEHDCGIETTFQLIGQFLLLKKPNMKSKDHLDAFWFWLQSKGIHAHRSAIVYAISEKVSIFIPSIIQENTEDMDTKQ